MRRHRHRIPAAGVNHQLHIAESLGRTRNVEAGERPFPIGSADIKLADQEGFSSVEHLKRYTTLGMATDQGKTANVLGLAIMAERAERIRGQLEITPRDAGGTTVAVVLGAPPRRSSV